MVNLSMVIAKYLKYSPIIGPVDLLPGSKVYIFIVVVFHFWCYVHKAHLVGGVFVPDEGLWKLCQPYAWHSQQS